MSQILLSSADEPVLVSQLGSAGSAPLLDGSAHIAASVIADGSIAIGKLATTGIPLSTSYLNGGGVWEAVAPSGAASGDLTGNYPAPSIAAGVITTSHISATAGILGSQLSATAGIVGGQIAATTITGGNLVNGTITTTQISGSAGILGSQLSSTAGILGSQLSATAGITGGQIASGTITTTQISGSAGITGGQLAAGTITATQIAADAITNTRILDGAVGSSKIAASAINSSHISSSAGILGGQLSATANIVGTQLASNAAILGSQLSASANILGSQLSASAGITGGQIASSTITSANLASNAVTAANIAAGTITTNEISATAGITGGQIASGTITSSNIATSSSTHVVSLGLNPPTSTTASTLGTVSTVAINTVTQTGNTSATLAAAMPAFVGSNIKATAWRYNAQGTASANWHYATLLFEFIMPDRLVSSTTAISSITLNLRAFGPAIANQHAVMGRIIINTSSTTSAVFASLNPTIITPITNTWIPYSFTLTGGITVATSQEFYLELYLCILPSTTAQRYIDVDDLDIVYTARDA